MAHMLLIVEPLGQREERGADQGRIVYQQMLDFTEELRTAGVLQRPGGAAPRLIDGPFAEAKEMVGGFFLLNVATRDEALAWAARCPAAQWATIEVRETGPCFL
jgi:hypothetical protein